MNVLPPKAVRAGLQLPQKMRTNLASPLPSALCAQPPQLLRADARAAVNLRLDRLNRCDEFGQGHFLPRPTSLLRRAVQ